MAVDIITKNRIADGTAPAALAEGELAVNLFDGKLYAGPIGGGAGQLLANGGALWDVATGGINYSAGNVGIGTTTPVTALHVNADTGAGAITISSGDNISILSMEADNTGNYQIAKLGGVEVGRHIFAPDDQRFIVGPLGTEEKMRITSAGNVGIGTIAPLTIADQTWLSLSAGAGTVSGLVLYTGGENRIGSLGASAVGLFMDAEDNIPIVFRIGTAPVTKMVLDAAGNLGIGDISPTLKLSVLGGGAQVIAGFKGTSASSGRVSYQDANTTGNTHVCAGAIGDDHAFWAGAVERMRIDATGKVGIGTSAPDELFHVETSTTANLCKFAAASHNAAMYIASTDSTLVDINVGANSNAAIAKSLSFSIGDTEAMRIDATGGVGIGTIAPGGNKLNIFQPAGAGNFVGALSITASNAAWNDAAGLIRVSVDGSSGVGSMINFIGASGLSVFDIKGNGLVFFPEAYNNTSASPANMVIASDGKLFRSTSSIKYKRDVVDYAKGLAELLTLRPVSYKGVSEYDGDTVYAGLIAEEVEAAGLTEFVTYEGDEPEGLGYGNMMALAVKAIQELTARLELLEAA